MYEIYAQKRNDDSFWGGLLLLVFAALWFLRGNTLMALGMLTMGLVAEANYILHRRSMKLNKINN